MTELLPCPFCGCEADICLTNKYWEEPEYTVQCDSCFTTVDSYDTEAEAIAAWNTRSAGMCEKSRVEGSGKILEGWTRFSCCDVQIPPVNDAIYESYKFCPNCGRKVSA